MSHAGPLSPSCPPPSAPTAMSADEPRSPDACSWWENLGSVCKATGADVRQWSGCSSWSHGHCHLSPAPHRDGFRLWQHCDTAQRGRPSLLHNCICLIHLLPLGLSAPDTSRSVILGGSDHPQNGGKTCMCPEKGTPNHSSPPWGQCVSRASERSIIGESRMVFRDTLACPGGFSSLN